MKKYLVYGLLVISVASAQAEPGDWCKGWTGCDEFTYVVKQLGFVDVAPEEQTVYKTAMSWVDYLMAPATETASKDSNLAWIKAKTEEVKVKADLAIGDLKKQSNPVSIEQNARHLAALLAACQSGDLEKCKDYGVGVDAYQIQLAASKKSATELSQLSIQAAVLKKDLSKAQDAIFEANNTQDLSKTLAAIEKYNHVAERIDALVKGIKMGNVNQGNAGKRSVPSMLPLVAAPENSQALAPTPAPAANVIEPVKQEKAEDKELAAPSEATKQDAAQ